MIKFVLDIYVISYLNFIEKAGDLSQAQPFLFHSDSKNGGNNKTIFVRRRIAYALLTSP
jgi:hypothetical protein